MSVGGFHSLIRPMIYWPAADCVLQSRRIVNRRLNMNPLFRPFVSHLLLFCAGCLATGDAAADDLRQRLKDKNGVQTDLWVYNDIPKAMAEAKRVNKPLFVTFRCVPCK